MAKLSHNSLCNMCAFYINIKGKHICEAFPYGIPDEYILGKKNHTRIDKKQEGQDVFFDKDPYLNL